MQPFSQQPASTQQSRQQQRQRQRNRSTLSTFVTTFNLNGALPSSVDVQNWLGRSNETSVLVSRTTTDAGDDHDTSSASASASAAGTGTADANAAADADLVIISLQECPTKPSSSGTCTATTSRVGVLEPLVLSMGISGGTVVNTKVDHGGNENIDTSFDDDSAFVEAIQAALSADHGLVADISMGVEPGTATPFSSSSSSTGATKAPVKWYGYIRLLVYARDDALIDELRRTSFPILIPVGTKLRVLDQDQSISVADVALNSVDELIINTQLSLRNRLQYYQLGSPDKGAVCLALPTLGTMVVASHLAGTNAYGVPEMRFDRIRHRQLESISNALEDALMNAGRCVFVGDKNDMTDWGKIIAGDLNFRVEVHNGKDDKRRGGRDWRVVADIVQSSGGIDNDTCKKQQVIDLFCNHDRLQNYLDRGPLCLYEEEGNDAKAISHRLPSVLTDTVDLIHLQCVRQQESARESAWNDVILPTFPFRTSTASSSATCSTTLDDSGPKSSNLPRRRFYTDKRTPSWTDRLLVSRGFFENEMKDVGKECVLIRSCPDICISDHIPVKCYLDLTYDRD
eukprot:CAMPEP_0178567160 /NCGR_PEP_ID=MMETSP0697-20121206/15169_1 /TAXON_ID=265572 /ORGANISM="Extubocellulus spinifer, Strain CCMP396" /LENGTH=570 /DNA_ID=CAMNT_0020201059 /DNA_START=261 /DNA_END=1973 /DNA_ORIENTATION=-